MSGSRVFLFYEAEANTIPRSARMTHWLVLWLYTTVSEEHAASILTLNMETAFSSKALVYRHEILKSYIRNN